MLTIDRLQLNQGVAKRFNPKTGRKHDRGITQLLGGGNYGCAAELDLAGLEPTPLEGTAGPPSL